MKYIKGHYVDSKTGKSAADFPMTSGPALPSDRAKLSRADFKLALLERGELDAVKTAMTDPSADPRAVILWEDALEFRRTNKDLLALASELGYTEEQLDDVFGINI